MEDIKTHPGECFNRTALMFQFILKGVFRDRSRSLFPVLVVFAGVFLLFFGACFIEGSLENFIKSNSSFATGHVKIQSYPSAQEAGSGSLELALETDPLFFSRLKIAYPGFRWTRRTNFGGLMDLPDEGGETRAQSPVTCIAVDLLSKKSIEATELNLERCLSKGRIPATNNEILISTLLAKKLSVHLNDKVTILTSNVDGASTAGNFFVCGFINFGIPMLDRGTIMLDVAGADYLLDMEGYSSEILGFSKEGFQESAIRAMANEYNDKMKSNDEYRPYMVTLMDQNNLQSMLATLNDVMGFLLFLFTFLMAMVLWNAGLISGIRRFSEVGVRLAIGERRRHIVSTLLIESLATGSSWNHSGYYSRSSSRILFSGSWR